MRKFFGTGASDNDIFLFGRTIQTRAAEAVIDLGLVVAEFAEVELIVHYFDEVDLILTKRFTRDLLRVLK
jgi:hypothetical protein